MKRKIKIGSRDSRLAVIQAQWVMQRLQKACPELSVELITMKTTGDLILDRRLDEIGGKGLFVKELDRALRSGEIDLSVHSLKDMPAELPPDLPLLALTERESPLDVLVLPKGKDILSGEGPVGSSSARRRVQLRELLSNPVQSVRGNVLTRLQKLDEGQFSALVLAKAGLVRLGLTKRISRVFSPDEMIPAAGQGILAVQGRAGENTDFLEAVRDPLSETAGRAERRFVACLEGGCSSPIAAFAEINGQELLLRGLYCDEESGKLERGSIAGEVNQAEILAERLAEELKRRMQG